MASGPITSWQIDRQTVADFIFWGSKSLQMVIAALKLKGVTPSKESYDQPRQYIDYAKAFECVDHSKLWKILKEKILKTRPPDLPL